MIYKLTITPLGPVFFRKDRDFSNVGANILDSYDFPTRKSIALVVAKYILKTMGDNKEASAHHNIDVYGPFIGLKKENDDTAPYEPYITLNVDGLYVDNTDTSNVQLVMKTSPKGDYLSDVTLLTNTSGIYLCEEDKNCPYPNASGKLFNLLDLFENKVNIHTKTYDSCFVRQSRVGIGLDAKTKTTTEGLLYQIEPIYLNDCTYLAYIQTETKINIKDITIPLGGEQFLVDINIEEVGECETIIFKDIPLFEPFDADEKPQKGLFYHITDMVIPGRKKEKEMGNYESSKLKLATFSKYQTPFNTWIENHARYVGRENRERAYLSSKTSYVRLILRDNYIIPKDINSIFNNSVQLYKVGSSKYGMGLLLTLPIFPLLTAEEKILQQKNLEKQKERNRRRDKHLKRFNNQNKQKKGKK